jgi:hypothetical protein
MSARRTPEFDAWLGWARKKINALDPLHFDE